MVEHMMGISLHVAIYLDNKSLQPEMRYVQTFGTYYRANVSSKSFMLVLTDVLQLSQPKKFRGEIYNAWN